MNPTSHRLLPKDRDVDMVCAAIEFGAGLRNPLARALPEVVLIRLRELPTLDMTLTVLFREAAEQHCGRQAVLDRLIEVVFIQVLRDLMDQQRLQVGLLAGLAEPRLAKAINAMHVEPAVALDGTLTYTPAPNAFGTSSFDVVVQDAERAGRRGRRSTEVPHGPPSQVPKDVGPGGGTRGRRWLGRGLPSRRRRELLGRRPRPHPPRRRPPGSDR